MVNKIIIYQIYKIIINALAYLEMRLPNYMHSDEFCPISHYLPQVTLSLFFFLFGCLFFLCLAGISCAYSFARILHLADCRVLLWLTPSLVRILCRLSWVITTQRSTAAIISVNSSLHPIRLKKWKRKWLSYTKHTGMSDIVGLKEVIVLCHIYVSS